MNPHARRSRWPLLPALFILATGCASSPKNGHQQTFQTPQTAAQSLVDALRHHDKSRLEKILGPGGHDILSSGDKVADRADAARFLALYDARHRIETSPQGVSTLLVGDDDWPFPVPIVKSGDHYTFDVETGKEEILNRRIGRNELAVEQVCLAIVDAQREYVRLNPAGAPLPEYARKIISDPGKKNGLFWPTAPGEPQSPLGPLAAEATAEGYGQPSAPTEGPRPYHGYEYRLLTAQGPNADGGAMDFMVNNHLVGGFGVVAYPAQYGNSGIMTFITSHDGVVYQRDLGPDTKQLAEKMTAFDPGPGWIKASDDAQITTTD